MQVTEECGAGTHTESQDGTPQPRAALGHRHCSEPPSAPGKASEPLVLNRELKTSTI